MQAGEQPQRAAHRDGRRRLPDDGVVVQPHAAELPLCRRACGGTLVAERPHPRRQLALQRLLCFELRAQALELPLQAVSRVCAGGVVYVGVGLNECMCLVERVRE